MITAKDLYDIIGNKIANEAQKAIIRNNFPPQIAERMCEKGQGGQVSVSRWHEDASRTA